MRLDVSLRSGMAQRLLTVVMLSMMFGLAGITTSEAQQADQAQITRGRQIYSGSCSACHGQTLQGGPGGPAVTGQAFATRWSARPSGALLQYIRDSMPLGAPRSLSNAAYADVTAFLLNRAGVTAARAAPAQRAEVRPRRTARVTPPAPTPEPEVTPAVAPPEAAPPPRPLDAAGRAAEERRVARLARLTPVTDELLRNPPDGEWLMWRRTYDSQGFSNLRQINRSSVRSLRQAWSWQLAPGDNEITPLVHDGVMFIVSSGRIDALDATNGDVLWQYTRPDFSGIQRGLAIYGDRIFMAAGASMVALDMRTGHVVWEREISPAANGMHMTAAPLAAGGRIFQGMSFCTAPNAGSCYIFALDAATGAEVWRFNTIAQPGAPGGDTWNDTPAPQRSGGAVWTTGSYDADLDLLFVGTGNTYQTEHLLRGTDRAAGLYTNTTLALRPSTGELIWHYQHVDGDVWDLDWSFERTLARMNIGGVTRTTVTTGSKLGIFDTLDAATGQYLLSNDVGYQNLISAIDPETGAKHIDASMVPTGASPVLVCPGGLGGRNWPATAYNPNSGVIFVPYNRSCMSLIEGLRMEGSNPSMEDPRNPEGLIGGVAAIDVDSRRVVWQQRERSPQASAILATAGGLVFDGARDRWFRARDERTGEILWQTRLDSAPSSYPITYSVDGVQYVAVVAGGGNFVDTLIGRMAPEIVTPIGRPTLWIFRLPGRR